jgi:hypothetical protein
LSRRRDSDVYSDGVVGYLLEEAPRAESGASSLSEGNSTRRGVVSAAAITAVALEVMMLFVDDVEDVLEGKRTRLFALVAGLRGGMRSRAIVDGCGGEELHIVLRRECNNGGALQGLTTLTDASSVAKVASWAMNASSTTRRHSGRQSSAMVKRQRRRGGW